MLIATNLIEDPDHYVGLDSIDLRCEERDMLPKARAVYVTLCATCGLCVFWEPAKPAQHYSVMKLLKRESTGCTESSENETF